MKRLRLLIINPGSTSTKIAVFNDNELYFEKNLRHTTEEIRQFKQVADQLLFRLELITESLHEANISLESLDCVIGRGGLLRPLCGGTYRVNEVMCRELLGNVKREHASNLGALIAKRIADSQGIPAYIVDPVVVDEMEPIARVAGTKGIERVSIFHALNQKAVARKAAATVNRKYEDCNMIVAHLGGGISVGAHQKGLVIDVNNALDGEGPFSAERSGGLPVCSIIDMCYSGLSRNDVYKSIVGKGGLIGYLNTNDARVVERLISQGNEEAKLIYEAMAYQVAKEIGSCAAVLKGRVDLIVLTGGIAYSQMLTQWIKERVEFIAPVVIIAGEDEMSALAEGGLRVLKGLEASKEYV